MSIRLKRYEDVDDPNSVASPESYPSRSKLVKVPSYTRSIKSKFKPGNNHYFDLYRSNSDHLQGEPGLLNTNRSPSFLNFNEENPNNINSRVEEYIRNPPQYDLINKMQTPHVGNYAPLSEEGLKFHSFDDPLLNGEQSSERFPINERAINQMFLKSFLLNPTYTSSSASDHYINSLPSDQISLSNSLVNQILTEPQLSSQIYPARDLSSFVHNSKPLDRFLNQYKDPTYVDKKNDVTPQLDQTPLFDAKNGASYQQNLMNTRGNEKDYKRVFDNETVVEYISDDDKIMNKTNDLILINENHGESANDTLEFKNLLEEARKTKEQIDILSSKLEKDPEEMNKVSNASKKSKTDEESLENDINVERGVRQLLVKHLIQVQIDNHRKEEALETLLRHFPVTTSDLKTWNITKGALKAIIRAKLTLLEPVVKKKTSLKP